ncbi:MAG: phosphodiester glycosidase family protein [Streptosporangiaceae bacterium]
MLTALALITVSWSYGHALAAPGSVGVGVRTVEWVRNHGGALPVSWAEDVWYRLHAPPKGGNPPPGAIPPADHSAGQTRHKASGRTHGPVHLPPPKPIPSIAHPPLPGEGHWHPAGRRVHGLPAVYVAYLRPDHVHTSLVAGVAWMDPKLLAAKLFAGNQQPGGGPWPYMAPIPRHMRQSLVAAFNSGFKLQDAHGGFYAYGRTAKPLVKGAASLVVDKNGAVNVGTWGHELHMSPRVAAVRQNLTLIVDHGRPVPGLGHGSYTRWGTTVGNQVLVWRSAVGITRHGALLYVAGDGLSVSSLANVLAHAGAVRGMEMDINSSWTSFYTFHPAPGHPAKPANARKLLKAMVRPPKRYFVPSARDFIALFARRP